MFRRYYLAILGEFTPNVFNKCSNKIGHNKQGYVVVSIMQNFIDFD